MPRRKFVDKKTATTFALVHRPQNDPLIHDETASSMVFTEISGPSTDVNVDSQVSRPRSKKVKQRGDLEEEFGFAVRSNEGEAAEHGVFYDDSRYDYMQHMRELGTSDGSITWVEAPVEGNKKKDKGKGKMKLEDALREMDIGDGQSEGGISLASSKSLLPDDVLPSEFVQKRTYQDQQDVPDAIAGFQPDMDPRLREVLEALEDEAYVDDEDDIFAELAKDVEVVDRDEWEESGWEEAEALKQLDEGWESDDTVKPSEPTSSSPPPTHPSADAAAAAEAPSLLPPPPTEAPPDTTPDGEGTWLADYARFKKDLKSGNPLPRHPTATPSNAQSASALTGASSLLGGRKKKRKGAMTSTTNYSMTSSALARTDLQTLLDARFDKIEESYAEDADGDYDAEDSASLASGATGLSQISGFSRASGMSSMSRASRDEGAPQLVRSDFDSIMDDFLGGHSTTGKVGRRRVKKGGYQTGLEQLDEVRQGLGPARLKAGKA
ncbi:Protein ltv1 [Elasticomyces elasticus]|nr:Protein ltv1 [Elasticomyces elasticus]